MPVTLNIIESTTALGLEVVEVVLASASEPGPAGPGVPAGGTVNQVLTKDSSTDYDTSWQDAQGGAGGAPTDVDYLVGTASGDLSAEIVVGTTPGGELGGTWASPTVDATHSGSSHAAVQAAAEATASAALAAHVGAADPHTGYRLESVPIAAADVAADVATQAELDAVAAASVNDGDAAGGVLSGTYPNPGFASDMATQAELDAHVNDTSAAHAASAVSADSTTLVGTGTDVQAVLEELDNAIADHLADTSDSHDASAISLADVGGNTAETDVEGAIDELYGLVGGGTPPGTELDYAEITTSATSTATTEGTAVAVVTGNSVAYDGSTEVVIEFFCVSMDCPADTNAQLVLYEDGSSIGLWAFLSVTASGSTTALPSAPIYLRRLMTPASGSHTYSVRLFGGGAGTKTVYAGAGGSGANLPAYLRITKA